MANFPKWVYARGNQSKIVEDPDELYSLGPGWYESPPPEIPEGQEPTPEQRAQLNAIVQTPQSRPRKKLLGRTPVNNT